MSHPGFLGSAAFLWPALLSAEAGRATLSLAEQLVDLALPPGIEEGAEVRDWTSKNEVLLELPTMQLRNFSTGSAGTATLICAPFALHAANIADFAPGHSLVEFLRSSGIERLFATDWRSAEPEMRFFSIDTYLADLNVAVDDAGGKVDLIGICQGGWLGVLYAARFPDKVRKLVVAGAPIDVFAGDSPITTLAATVPLTLFEQLVKSGQGRVLGQRAFSFWGSPALDPARIAAVLQPTVDDRVADRRGPR